MLAKPWWFPKEEGENGRKMIRKRRGEGRPRRGQTLGQGLCPCIWCLSTYPRVKLCDFFGQLRAQRLVYLVFIDVLLSFKLPPKYLHLNVCHLFQTTGFQFMSQPWSSLLETWEAIAGEARRARRQIPLPLPPILCWAIPVLLQAEHLSCCPPQIHMLKQSPMWWYLGGGAFGVMVQES